MTSEMAMCRQACVLRNTPGGVNDVKTEQKKLNHGIAAGQASINLSAGSGPVLSFRLGRRRQNCDPVSTSNWMQFVSGEGVCPWGRGKAASY